MTGRSTKRMGQKGLQTLVMVVAAAAAAGLDGIWVCVCVCVCGCQGNGLAIWLIHLLWQMDVGVPAGNFLC